MVLGYAASNRNIRMKDRYDTHRTRIDNDVISLTNSLMSYDLKTVYAILGAQLAQIERPHHAFQTAKMLGFASGLDVPKISIDYVSEGHECIKLFWPKIVPPVCRWWKSNRGKGGRRAHEGNLCHYYICTSIAIQPDTRSYLSNRSLY